VIDATLIKAVADLATQAARPNIVEIPGGSKGEYLLWNPAANRYETCDRAADKLDVFLSLPTLAAYAAAHEVGIGGSFWYSRAGVTYVSSTSGLDRGTLPLTLSAPIKQLAEWSRSHERMKQETAALKLRTLFAGATVPGDLLTIVSGIAWKIDEAGKSAVGNGARSVGRGIEARIENRDKLPDVVVFNVPVWENGGPLVTSIGAKVRCVLDADPSTQTFLFVPEAGAVEAAIGEAEDTLGMRLNGQIEQAFDGVETGRPPMYHGTPTKV
jgi:hypothetical protein